MGEKLKGILREYHKYVFNYKGTSYRIIYKVFYKEKMVFIVAIGVREGFYEKLARRLK